MEEKKVLLSIKDLEVKFRVRGRILTAIRGISLDIYEHESIAIVGESGSGKSVFTKTFAGMLDSNGFISNGSIIFDDEDLAETVVPINSGTTQLMHHAQTKLDEYAPLAFGGETYREMVALEAEKKARFTLSDEEEQRYTDKLNELKFQRTEAFNLRQTLDGNKDKAQIHEISQQISSYDEQIKKLEEEKTKAVRAHKEAAQHDSEYAKQFEARMAELKAKYEKEIAQPITAEMKQRNEVLAKEIALSVGRYRPVKRTRAANKLIAALHEAMKLGVDLDNDAERNKVFDTVAFRVRYVDETAERLHGRCVMNLANIRNAEDWTQIRGKKIATVFQDPMTSLNPILTIGNQITSIIIKHQHCSEVEARRRAIDLMYKVGIPNPERRFDDYPFQYSGGMRQRIVIAIALSCQPKILICDEPTTALDVTIQAQILQLLKDLQRELGFTIVFITHDLGVVANVADRVAVLYAGEMVELGTVEEVFYDPRHPYTWALLSSLPQLAQKNTKLYSITGTPPSLYNKIVGDPFAPRNPYCLKIDSLKEPPMFKVTETHYAKTWLLDPRAPKIEKPEAIDNIHEKLLAAFNI